MRNFFFFSSLMPAIFCNFLGGITHITQKNGFEMDFRLCGNSCFLESVWRRFLHPDGINPSTLPNKQNCQLFLSFWAILSHCLRKRDLRQQSEELRKELMCWLQPRYSIFMLNTCTPQIFRYTLLHVSRFTPIYILQCF